MADLLLDNEEEGEEQELVDVETEGDVDRLPEAEAEASALECRRTETIRCGIRVRL